MKKSVFVYEKIQCLRELTKRFLYIIPADKHILIRKNKQLGLSHKGERCFILGGGPSLNDCDVGLLRNEYVITVNSVYKNRRVCDAKPNLYLISDPYYFGVNDIDCPKTEISGITEFLSSNPGMCCVFPVQFRSKVDEFGWSGLSKVFYRDGVYFRRGYNGLFDLSYPCPIGHAVIQDAIISAIYMGFEKIYLLGVEETVILTNLEDRLHNNTSHTDYSYECDKEYLEWNGKVIDDLSLDALLDGFSEIFRIYRELGVWCEKHNVELANCSGESLIEGIKLKRFEDVMQ